ncbi:hypothetical protein EG327_000839 [Venturia inaequalis]|uniref:SWIM-type domain-containing protein n=1 Tax=Venturia inaequalis TaxID=5025 RepID=A0A8H3VN30_VENIN|nr:hypothetical protein EG327_000839 [Venturia inaequalis]
MSPSPTIPSPRDLLTNIFSPLPLPQQQEPSGPLSPSFKPTLLTLHILFPNELLPALDLLDRNLITKFILQTPQSTTTTDPTPPETTGKDHESPLPSPKPHDPQSPSPQSSQETPARKTKTPLYYVTSSQSQTQTPSNPRHAAPETQPPPHYEVRPKAWNCSCPAFAFSAFPATPPSPTSSSSPPSPELSPHRSVFPARKSPSVSDDEGEEEEESWGFGGLSVGAEIAMCKHLLACIMVERWKGFGENVEERGVSVEELAGWGAGWGG